MKPAKLLASLASLVSLTLVISGCQTSEESSGDGPGGALSNSLITYANEQEFTAYNNDNANASSIANQMVLGTVLGGFSHLDTTGNIVRDTDYGTYQKLSDNPLTVKYTFDPHAVWSDGVPINASDWYLYWAAHSNAYPQAGFQPASTVGIADIKKPTENPNSKSFTVVYKKPFGDWEFALGNATSPFLPAHVIEKATGTNVAEAVKNNDIPALKKIANFWNNNWTGFSPGNLPPANQIPSSGPYKIGEWKAGQSITLIPNNKWWGMRPRNGGIVIKLINQEQQLQALKNGDADVIEPQPNVDLINQAKGLGPGFEFHTGSMFSYDHLDFNVHKGPFANKDLRLALAKCLPRQDIVNKLIKPVQPDAQIMNTRNYYPFQPGYAEMAKAAGGEAYDKVDIAGSKALVAKSGIAHPTIRAYYLGNPNPRRRDTFDLIKNSCAKAGFRFNVQALTPQQWGPVTTNGDFDLILFAWSGSGLTSAVAPIFKTGGGSNHGRYSNPKMDKLCDEIIEAVDKDKQRALLTQIEKLAWSDMVTIPLYAFPGFVANNTDVENVKFNPTQTQAPFNDFDWQRVAR